MGSAPQPGYAYGDAVNQPTTIIQPTLTQEDRKQLEDAYRQAIGTVRALARALGKPCPIVSREERKQRVDKTLTEAVQCEM